MSERANRAAAAAAVALACFGGAVAAGAAAPAAPAARDEAHGAARVVVERPSAGAIAKAIAAVAPGGKVRIHEGRYRESLLIEKPGVKLLAAGKGRPVIDGRCEAASTIMIRSPGVTLKGLKVGGGGFANVDFSGVPSGRADDLRLRNTCDTEYGINVFDSGSLTITDNRASGFTDAGIYVGAIASTPSGPLLVGDNDVHGNNKGLIVEDSAGGEIVLFSNEVHDNAIAGVGEQVGIYVHASGGVRITTNRVRANGSVGLLLTEGSDGNLVVGNEITSNPTDVRNEGAANCGSGNTFVTGGPLAPC